MTFRQTKSLPTANSFKCSECGSTRAYFQHGKLTCTNCGHVEKVEGHSKFGSRRTEGVDGIKRDSKFEATVADTLHLRKRAGDILDYDTQFKVEMWAHRPDGIAAFCIRHKIDFRIHHKDGSFELLEAKGIETADYKMRRKFLEHIWLPMHPDHTYTVVKQQDMR